MAGKKPSQGMAIAGLILNILVLPGLGTLIAGGKTRTGVIQIVLYVVGIVLTVTIIGAILGIPLILAAWIWGIVSAIGQLKAAS